MKAEKKNNPVGSGQRRRRNRVPFWFGAVLCLIFALTAVAGYLMGRPGYSLFLYAAGGAFVACNGGSLLDFLRRLATVI